MSLTWAGADETFGPSQLTGVLLLSAVVVLLALVAVRISARSGLPTLLLYLGLGLALGESGLGIHFSDVNLTQVLGYSALILILAEGGLTTRWSGIRDIGRAGRRPVDGRGRRVHRHRRGLRRAAA